MIRKLVNWLLLLVIFLIPTPSLAQVSPWQLAALALQIPTGGPALTSFLNHSNRRGSDPVFVQGVLTNAKTLQDQGLPTGPYFLKADEGLMKGIPPHRMQPALRQTQQQTFLAGHFADQAIRRGWVQDTPWMRQDLTQRYQWALLNGVPPGQLNRMNRGFRPLGPPSANFIQLNQELRNLSAHPRSHWKWDDDFEKGQKGQQPGWNHSEKGWKDKQGHGPEKAKYKKPNHSHKSHPHSGGKGPKGGKGHKK